MSRLFASLGRKGKSDSHEEAPASPTGSRPKSIFGRSKSKDSLGSHTSVSREGSLDLAADFNIEHTTHIEAGGESNWVDEWDDGPVDAPAESYDDPVVASHGGGDGGGAVDDGELYEVPQSLQSSAASQTLRSAPAIPEQEDYEMPQAKPQLAPAGHVTAVPKEVAPRPPSPGDVYEMPQSSVPPSKRPASTAYASAPVAAPLPGTARPQSVRMSSYPTVPVPQPPSTLTPLAPPASQMRKRSQETISMTTSPYTQQPAPMEDEVYDIPQALSSSRKASQDPPRRTSGESVPEGGQLSEAAIASALAGLPDGPAERVSEIYAIPEDVARTVLSHLPDGPSERVSEKYAIPEDTMRAALAHIPSDSPATRVSETYAVPDDVARAAVAMAPQGEATRVSETYAVPDDVTRAVLAQLPQGATPTLRVSDTYTLVDDAVHGLPQGIAGRASDIYVMPESQGPSLSAADAAGDQQGRRGTYVAVDDGAVASAAPRAADGEVYETVRGPAAKERKPSREYVVTLLRKMSSDKEGGEAPPPPLPAEAGKPRAQSLESATEARGAAPDNKRRTSSALDPVSEGRRPSSEFAPLRERATQVERRMSRQTSGPMLPGQRRESGESQGESSLSASAPAGPLRRTSGQKDSAPTAALPPVPTATVPKPDIAVAAVATPPAAAVTPAASVASAPRPAAKQPPPVSPKPPKSVTAKAGETEDKRRDSRASSVGRREGGAGTSSKPADVPEEKRRDSRAASLVRQEVGSEVPKEEGASARRMSGNNTVAPRRPTLESGRPLSAKQAANALAPKRPGSRPPVRPKPAHLAQQQRRSVVVEPSAGPTSATTGSAASTASADADATDGNRSADEAALPTDTQGEGATSADEAAPAVCETASAVAQDAAAETLESPLTNEASASRDEQGGVSMAERVAAAPECITGEGTAEAADIAVAGHVDRVAPEETPLDGPRDTPKGATAVETTGSLSEAVAAEVTETKGAESDEYANDSDDALYDSQNGGVVIDEQESSAGVDADALAADESAAAKYYAEEDAPAADDDAEGEQLNYAEPAPYGEDEPESAQVEDEPPIEVSGAPAVSDYYATEEAHDVVEHNEDEIEVQEESLETAVDPSYAAPSGEAEEDAAAAAHPEQADESDDFAAGRDWHDDVTEGDDPHVQPGVLAEGMPEQTVERPVEYEDTYATVERPVEHEDTYATLEAAAEQPEAQHVECEAPVEMPAEYEDTYATLEAAVEQPVECEDTYATLEAAAAVLAENAHDESVPGDIGSLQPVGNVIEAPATAVAEEQSVPVIAVAEQHAEHGAPETVQEVAADSAALDVEPATVAQKDAQARVPRETPPSDPLARPMSLAQPAIAQGGRRRVIVSWTPEGVLQAAKEGVINLPKKATTTAKPVRPNSRSKPRTSDLLADSVPGSQPQTPSSAVLSPPKAAAAAPSQPPALSSPVSAASDEVKAASSSPSATPSVPETPGTAKSTEDKDSPMSPIGRPIGKLDPKLLLGNVVGVAPGSPSSSSPPSSHRPASAFVLPVAPPPSPAKGPARPTTMAPVSSPLAKGDGARKSLDLKLQIPANAPTAPTAATPAAAEPVETKAAVVAPLPATAAASPAPTPAVAPAVAPLAAPSVLSATPTSPRAPTVPQARAVQTAAQPPPVPTSPRGAPIATERPVTVVEAQSAARPVSVAPVAPDASPKGRPASVATAAASSPKDKRASSAFSFKKMFKGGSDKPQRVDVADLLSRSLTVISVVIGRQTYRPTDPDHLAFNVDETLSVMNIGPECPRGTWLATNAKGQAGFVPSALVAMDADAVRKRMMEEARKAKGEAAPTSPVTSPSVSAAPAPAEPPAPEWDDEDDDDMYASVDHSKRPKVAEAPEFEEEIYDDIGEEGKPAAAAEDDEPIYESAD